MTDGERVADVDNPKGYYEWEAIKQVARNPKILDEEGLDGRAIKCISMLLPKMPARHAYKVIFMTRPIEEVVESQAVMMKRLETKGAELDSVELERALTAHRNETRRWLKTSPNVEFLEIDYPALMRDPSANVTKLVEFLGVERLPTPEKIAGVVDESLYRRKRKAS